jgi:general secretion pathway protein F
MCAAHMPRFHVRYIAASGTSSETAVDAPRAQAVASALGVRECDIIVLRELDALPPARMARIPSTRHSPRLAFPLRTFCQELSVLLDSGIPLYEALQTLQEKESSSDVARVLTDITAQLSQGRTFAQALQARLDVFGALFVATIEASQRTGHIAGALRRHGEYLAWLHGLRDRLVTAAIYPVILIAASALVMGFLTVFVIPRFAQIYADIGGDLPLLSRLLLNLGSAVDAHPLVVTVLAAAVVVGVIAAWRMDSVRRALIAQVWRLPQIGARARLMELAGFYRTLGMLIEAGVPMVAALETCTGVIGTGLGAAVTGATERVREGQRLSDSLDAEGLATPVSLRMVRVGEHSGQLGPMLERAAAFYDEELARFAEWIGKVVNPVLMLVMGVVIGGVVILMYLPIFQIADQIQ